ncbi:MAG: PilZ domain-containing protein [Bdellovibrionales bacterium]|nr:PilZ domain-containing protein [Bdellovibrionales bacterium]
MTLAKKFDSAEKEHISLHSPFFPEEVREHDFIFGKLTIHRDEKPETFKAKIWRISPLGIEFTFFDSDIRLAKGEKIEFNLFLFDKKMSYSGLILDEELKDNHYFVRLNQENLADHIGKDRRLAKRWAASEFFYPSCTTKDPVKYNQYIHFKVKNMSKNGLQLVTSLRNKFLFVGMEIECILNFPLSAQFSSKLEIKNVSIKNEGQNQYLQLGVRFKTNIKQMRQSIAQYLLQFGSATSLTALLKEGLNPKTMNSSISFSYVKTEEEFKEVLSLRHRNYLSSNKIDKTLTPEDMADKYDARSRIVIGKYRNKIVASCRLIFSDNTLSLEHSEYINLEKVLPDSNQIVEMMRLCIDPDFRGSLVMLEMFEFMALTIVHSKRKWILTSVTKDKVKRYLNIGFKDTGLNYCHEKLNGIEHRILIGNVEKAMLGEGVSPLYWNLVWSGISNYMDGYKILSRSEGSQLRIALYRLLEPMARLIRFFRNLRLGRHE